MCANGLDPGGRRCAATCAALICDRNAWYVAIQFAGGGKLPICPIAPIAPICAIIAAKPFTCTCVACVCDTFACVSSSLAELARGSGALRGPRPGKACAEERYPPPAAAGELAMESAAIVAAAASPAMPMPDVVACVASRPEWDAEVAEWTDPGVNKPPRGGRAPCELNSAGGAVPVGLCPPRCVANAMERPPMLMLAGMEGPASGCTPCTRCAFCWSPSSGASFTMSNKLDRRLRLFMLFCRMKYFCAWLATCVGVRDCTKCREMPLQSPLPSFCKPRRNSRCSSSVHGTPFLRSRVGAAAESDMWPFSVTEGSTSRVSAFIISSADCVLRIPSVAAPTSASRPDAMVGRESVGFAAFDWLAWCREPRCAWASRVR
mmetsp:Transcript_5974/g.19863  ORF Transcript_5974/g.19863 Transcript_5974/m.19863 type:complete len:377 (-) Transcript_5974:1246-2376(-)